MGICFQHVIGEIIVNRHCPNLTLTQWRDLILVARAHALLPRIAVTLLNSHCSSKVIPEEVNAHLLAAKRHARLFHNQVKSEIDIINKILSSSLERNIIVLKGAGYVLAHNPAASGRIFADIDLLVLQSDLHIAETTLHLFGFLSTSDSDYDQKYYREWAHEIPPLRHLKRGTVLDVHHNIVPVVSGRAPDITFFLDSTVEVKKGVDVLRPSAMFLHSAVHLFFGEAFNNGFRDLTDLSLLLDEFSDDEDELRHLIHLADKTGFEREMYFAFRYLNKILNKETPKTILSELCDFRISQLKLAVLDFMFCKVLALNHRLVQVRYLGLAQNLVFIRGHMLKMPIKILVKHSISKLWRFCIESLVGDIDKSMDKKRNNL
ncbi:nucleotidyltransferase family protein [Alteromonas sp. A081]|uniref:nucleotidyltransferase family protein n=1 Tax=Alteromonas sp. A081 TaxID=3410269 RepID=UPI003B97D17D